MSCLLWCEVGHALDIAVSSLFETEVSFRTAVDIGPIGERFGPTLRAIFCSLFHWFAYLSVDSSPRLTDRC